MLDHLKISWPIFIAGILISLQCLFSVISAFFLALIWILVALEKIDLIINKSIDTGSKVKVGIIS